MQLDEINAAFRLQTECEPILRAAGLTPLLWVFSRCIQSGIHLKEVLNYGAYGTALQLMTFNGQVPSEMQALGIALQKLADFAHAQAEKAGWNIDYSEADRKAAQAELFTKLQEGLK